MTIPATDLSGMLETAVVAARLAGQHAMEQLHTLHKSVKNGNELVTQADPACQKLIIDHIRQAWPDHGFIGEEGDSGRLLKIAPRREPAVWWIIDPIDGTNNYANGLLSFCVSIAAMADGKPVVGVVFDPTTESLYSTAAQMDAQQNNSTIKVNSDKISMFSSFGVDCHATEQTNAGTRKMMEQTRFRCLGTTALHLAYVANGALIGTVSPAAKLWDIAAGAILVQQAGGRVTDPAGKDLFPIDLVAYNGEQLSTLATNATAHQAILDIFLNH